MSPFWLRHTVLFLGKAVHLTDGGNEPERNEQEENGTETFFLPTMRGGKANEEQKKGKEKDLRMKRKERGWKKVR